MSESKENGGLHILVAEDNKVNQQLMKIILKNLGHTCDIAPEGRTALEYLHTHTYDLAIIDIHMPVMDGFQLVKKIRSNIDLKVLPVFALSAATSTSETSDLLEAGCDDYVHKPIDTYELERKINGIIQKKA